MPIRISFLLDQLAHGGAEKHAIMMANGVDRARFAAGISYLVANSGMLPLVQRDRLEYLDCLDIGFWLDLRAAFRFGAARKADRTQIVVAANPYSTLYAITARRLTRARFSVISTYHTTLLQTWKEKLQSPLYLHAMRSSDALVYMSNYQRDHWRQRRLHARRELTIYNGVDIAHYSPAAQFPSAQLPADWQDSDYVIGICAGLRPEKSHADLLGAVATLAGSGVAIRCLLIGDGPERDLIEREANALGIRDRIFITGFMEDVRPYMRLCDVMVLASRTETFSLSSLESMAMGIPMVMSDVGGAREQMIVDETGLLFPHGDVAALADCLEKLLPDGLRRSMGEQAMRNVRERFSVGRMIHQYEQLFTEVADARPLSAAG